MAPKLEALPLVHAEWTPDQLPAEFRLARSRIMYVESKSAGLEGPARIGRVFFSKSGKTFITVVSGFKALKVMVSRRTILNLPQVITIGSQALAGTRTIVCTAAVGGC
jgi:hypothetical protein